jgi:hypothetical protein
MKISKPTALLLNYKRPENINAIIENIKSQSIPINIFLWNNNNEDNKKYPVDLQINSSLNLMCSPRWLMSGYSESEYFFSLDDDLNFKDSKVIEDCVSYATNHNCAIGYQGVVIGPSKQYWNSKHLGENHFSPNINNDISVDIIKGRFIFCSKLQLRKINFSNYKKADNYRIEDDIIISSKIDNKIIPKFLYNRFVELPAPHALWSQPDHGQSREKSLIKYYLNKKQF